MSLTLFIGSLCFDKLYLHVVENISLTYAKFSCSLFIIDSCFSHVMILCTIQESSKVHFFLSDFLVLEILTRDMFFDKMVKMTNMLVEPKA
jgi:hypothetical protein